jgi:hypothetical protein
MRSPWPRCATISPDRQGKSKRNSARRDQAARRRVGRLCYVCQRSSVAPQAPLGAGGATTSVQCGRRAPCALVLWQNARWRAGAGRARSPGQLEHSQWVGKGALRRAQIGIRQGGCCSQRAAVKLDRSHKTLGRTVVTRVRVSSCGMEKPPALLPGASSDPLGSGNSEAQYRKLRWIRK